MLAGTDDHLTWLSPVILNLENMGLTHLESEIRVSDDTQSHSIIVKYVKLMLCFTPSLLIFIVS